MDPTTIEQARAAKAEALKVFGSLAEVVGVGITRLDGQFAVKVNLAEMPDGKDLPTRVGRVPVRVEIVGEIGKV